jgi:mono/diheme cytochrome c family protein
VRRIQTMALLAAALGFAACSDDDEPPLATLPTLSEEARPPASPNAAPGPEIDPGEAPPPSPETLARAAAPKAALEPVTTDWSGGDPAVGQQLYVQYCTICHGAGGHGDGPGAAALNPKPRDFTSGVFYLDGDADAQTGEPVDLARVIQKGAAPFGGSPAMQAWEGTLDEAQIRNLVAYLSRLSAAGHAGG